MFILVMGNTVINTKYITKVIRKQTGIIAVSLIGDQEATLVSNPDDIASLMAALNGSVTTTAASTSEGG